MKLKIIILIILKLLIIIVNSNELELIENCYNNGLQPKKKLKDKDDIFEMHFGDPAVEVWNVFTGHDIHRIYLLEECVRKHINKTFININQTNIIDDHFRQHDGSNVTFLIGYFQ